MVTPYYRSERVTLYLGDCRDVVPTLPRQSADLIIADPPYGQRWQSTWRKDRFAPMAGDDGTVDWPGVLGDTVRHLLRGKRHVYVFGYGEDDLRGPLHLGATARLVWDKAMLGAGDLSLPWGPGHEPITFGVYRDRPSDRATGRGGLAARLRQGSVLRVPRPNGAAVRHPDEKPVELIRRLVESSSCLGETVADITCGVGSTVVATVLSGRRAIGIETDERYLSIAVDRVREAERLARLAEAC